MAVYADQSDNQDPVVQVSEQDLEQADAWLDSQLRARGIDPVLVDPALAGGVAHPVLNKLALHYALVLAATRGQGDEGGILAEKIRHYRELLAGDLKVLGREALGLTPSSAGYGSATLGRA